MTFYDYLLEQFGYDEPILVQEVADKTGESKATIRQRLRRLVLKQQLERVQSGVYFIPSKQPLFGKPILDPNKVLTKKYLKRQNITSGYQTGINFANRLGLTTQTASVPVIATNQATRDQRTIQIYNNKIIIKKPRTPVTERNYKALQIFDLLNNFDDYSEKPLNSVTEVLTSYLNDTKLTEVELTEVLNQYPSKTKVRAYEAGLIKSEVAR